MEREEAALVTGVGLSGKGVLRIGNRFSKSEGKYAARIGETGETLDMPFCTCDKPPPTPSRYTNSFVPEN